MTRPYKSEPEFTALERALRADKVPDPGEAFFREMQREVMGRVAQRPAPKRPWWSRMTTGPWRVPAVALAGAAAVALVLGFVLWGRGPAAKSVKERPAATPMATSALGESVVLGHQPGPAVRLRVGQAWLAEQAPGEAVLDLQEEQLPALVATLQETTAGPLLFPQENDTLAPLVPGAPVTEADLEGLSEAQLRQLYQTLRRKLSRQRQPKRPAGPGHPDRAMEAMRRSG